MTRVKNQNSPKREKLHNKAGEPLKIIPLKFPESYMPILEELAIAFFKSGVIKKPLVSTMLMWNTDRLVNDVLAKKRAQLVRDLQEEVQRKAREEYEAKMRLYGYEPDTLGQQTKPKVIF